MNHDPGDSVCIEHSPTGIYTAVVHVCRLCRPDFRKCRHCGDVGPAGTDHTCPCPNSDEGCQQHPRSW